MLRRLLALLALALLGGCGGGGSPTEPPSPVTHGTLSGIVTIGPNCPVEQIGNPCPTPPDAFAQRKVLVYNATGAQLLFTVDINSQGFYAIDLEPGKYLVDLKRIGVDKVAGVPRSIDIQANATTRVDISIDTGIR